MTAWVHQSRPRPHWYALDQGARASLRAAWLVCLCASVKEGAVCLGRYSVRGQSDFERMELWRFEDVSGIERHWNRLKEAHYCDYMDTSNTLGMPADDAWPLPCG
jgi:hypothetical protein